jgi:hypothetical protein
MFRTTITIISSDLSFSTIEEFQLAIRQYFDSSIYLDRINTFTADNKQLNRTFTLTDNQTLTLVIDWDSEASFNEFYLDSADSFTNLENSGYTRTVTYETI